MSKTQPTIFDEFPSVSYKPVQLVLRARHTVKKIIVHQFPNKVARIKCRRSKKTNGRQEKRRSGKCFAVAVVHYAPIEATPTE